MITIVATVLTTVICSYLVSLKFRKQISTLKQENTSLKDQISKLEENTISTDDAANDSESEKLWQQYRKLQNSAPNYMNIYGRPLNYPKYTDKYDTGTAFTLRQLLLLVWWGRFSKRKITTRIPKYFFEEYNLNTKKLTNRFVAEGLLLENNDEQYVLSDEARKLVDIYSDLWEIHENYQFPLCLDEDYPTWNHGAILKRFCQNAINFNKEQIDYYKKLIQFYVNHPDFIADKDEKQHQIESLEISIDDDKQNIKKFEDKIKALE